MNMKTRNVLSQLLLALTIAIGITACSKNDNDELTPPANAITSVKLVFTDSTVNEKSAGSKVDLTKVASVKIKYAFTEGEIGINVVREATLMVKGDSSKVSTFDLKTLTFKGGSKLTIYAATLYDNTDKVLGGWSKEDNDVFEVTSPQGVAVMERTYGTVGLERL